jgi:hypothetical protein
LESYPSIVVQDNVEAKPRGASMIWTAGFRTAVISPYEQIQFTEPRGFADQTVRQVLHMAGGGERLRVRLTNRYGRTPLHIGAARVTTERGQAHPHLRRRREAHHPAGTRRRW